MLRPSRLICALLLVPTLTLSGCGLYQKAKQGTASVASAVFYRQVETLHLSFVAREAINHDDAQQSMPLRVSILQLNDRKTFDSAEYTDLLTQPDLALKDSLVAQQQLSVVPGQTANLDIPLSKNANFVAVVGLFRLPDRARGTWKLVLSRDDLDPDTPRIIEIRNNTQWLRSVK